jgi:hypothetical protein
MDLRKGYSKQNGIQQEILRLLKKPISRFPSAKATILLDQGMVVMELKQF